MIWPKLIYVTVSVGSQCASRQRNTPYSDISHINGVKSTRTNLNGLELPDNLGETKILAKIVRLDRKTFRYFSGSLAAHCTRYKGSVVLRLLGKASGTLLTQSSKVLEGPAVGP